MPPRARAPVSTASSSRAEHRADASNENTVLIVEEHVPEYRRPFFELLEAALSRQSIRLILAVGSTPSRLSSRGDAAAWMPFMRTVPARAFTIAGRQLTLRKLSQLKTDADLVILDQALRHLENYPLLLGQRRGPKVALWGHGIRRAKRAIRLEQLLERRTTKSAHWFFAYTRSGAAHVAATGFPRERITVVQNTLDVGELVRLREDVSADDQRRLRDQLRLPAQHVCLYVGALDASKRIEFLLEAGSVVAGHVPDFTLLIAGDGPDRALVEESLASRPWLRYVGRVVGRQKAELGAISDVLLMPGSIGLVAVDSFALQTPIVTTRWPFHGPEMDYLEDGVNARISDEGVAAYAGTVERVLFDRDELARLKAGCAAGSRLYSIESMVANFSEGVVAALATPRG